MSSLGWFASLGAITLVAFLSSKKKAIGLVPHPRQLSSLPGYFGSYVALWTVLPACALMAVWSLAAPALLEKDVLQSFAATELSQQEINLLLNDVKNLASGNISSRAADPEMQQAAAAYSAVRQRSALLRGVTALCFALAGFVLAYRRLQPKLRAMQKVEGVFKVFLMAGSTLAVLTTVGIVLSLLFEAMRFFRMVPISEFLFGLDWSPQTALRADQVGGSGAFGAIPLLAGTFLISAIAMSVAVPIGLLAAIYTAEYATARVRSVVKPLLEVLAGIPTVVYGFFAALTLAPFVRRVGESIGLDVASESALAAGAVMGIMIIPFVSSLSDDVICAVPKGLREASYGLGATQAETIRRVIFPAALPGIVGGILLAVSRAVGETMIVVMAAGLAANLTANPLEAVTTVTVQIVTLLVGDQEFDSAKTLSAFALGLVLFAITLVLNVIALYVVRRYREQYE